MFNTHRYVAILAVALATGACAAASTIGTLGTIVSTVGLPSPGDRQTRVTGEIRSLDVAAQRIRITMHDGQAGEIRYDADTEILYRQEPYAAAALQTGDLVVVDTRQDAQGQLHAERIFVQHSAQDRAGEGSRVQQFVGRIDTIDHDRGEFVLRTQHGEVTVALPFNAPKATIDFFRRLRSGDTVSLEGVPVAGGRVEIHRFL